MKKITFILSLIVLFSCSKKDEPQPQKEYSEYTFTVYPTGNSEYKASMYSPNKFETTVSEVLFDSNSGYWSELLGQNGVNNYKYTLEKGVECQFAAWDLLEVRIVGYKGSEKILDQTYTSGINDSPKQGLFVFKAE